MYLDLGLLSPSTLAKIRDALIEEISFGDWPYNSLQASRLRSMLDSVRDAVYDGETIAA